MALTGVLGADFTAFFDACQQAELKLKGFESGAGKVETQLKKIGDSFSGQKVIAEATLTATAIEKLGGVTKLTADELSRAGSVAQEAAEKFKALGKDVPQNIQNLADAAEKAHPPVGLLSAGLAGLAAGLGAGTLAKWAKDALEFASNLQDLADRTNISVEKLQQFREVADASGTSVDALAGAAFQLNKRLAGGKDTTVEALAELGLKLADLKQLDAAERLVAVADASAKIEDPMRRAAVQTALFGKSVDELQPAFKGLKDSSGALVVLSGEQVAAFDRIGDAIGRLAGSWKPALIQWIDTNHQFSSMIGYLDAIRGIFGELPTPTGSAAEAAKKYTDAMDDRALKPIVLSLGEEKRIVADLEGVFKAAAEAAKKLAAEQEAAAKALQHMLDVVERSDQISSGFTAKSVSLADALGQVGTHANVSTHDIDGFVAAQERAAKALQDEFDASFKAGQEQDALNAAMGKTASGAGTLASGADQESEAMKRMTQVATGLSQSLAGVQAAAEAAFAAAAKVNTSPFSGGFAGAVQAASFGSPTPGLTINPAIPRFAEGGPVTADGPIYAHAGEYVLPRGKAGGSVTNVYVTQPLGTPAAIARAVGEALQAQYRSGGGRLPLEG